MHMFFNQQVFAIRCEWGACGVAQLAPESDAVVIVDVLSFSTCVDIAVGNGAVVYPYRWHDASALAYAHARDAILASPKRQSYSGYSLSPTSLLTIPSGTRLVLPSPNGAALTLATGEVPTFAGCLRNATAVATAVQRRGKRISVIPAGERWDDGSLRPALEDLVGAGAIISHLPGTRSPEAELAVAAFQHVRHDIRAGLASCGSAKELIGRGFARDVELALALDVSDCAPVLTHGAYRHQGA
jgi:2-phosphosulfolactate phosphatase